MIVTELDADDIESLQNLDRNNKKAWAERLANRRIRRG
jgi:hypothetical protein